MWTMRTILSLVFWLSCVNAFRDASPFLLLSTSKLDADHAPASQVAQGREIISYLNAALKSCPSQTYIFVRQPGLSSADLKVHNSLPHLSKRFAAGHNTGIKTNVAVANVKDLDASALLPNTIAQHCNASLLTMDQNDSFMPSFEHLSLVIDLPLSELPVEHAKRALSLSSQDALVNSIIENLPNDSYTLVVLTTPTSTGVSYESSTTHEPTYLMEDEFVLGMHTDMKRDLSSAANQGGNINSDLPLFEKYQFVNAAIFMGITVALLLLMILYVGLSAISGLEVSYMAFSKEMSAAAQTAKQQ